MERMRSEDIYSIRRFYRRIGNSIAKKLMNRRITPNQVTFFGFFLGILACIFILTGRHYLLVIAALLLQLNLISDFVDGSLAYLTSTKTKLGEWLDNNLCIFVDTILFFAIGITLYRNDPRAFIWPLCFLCLAWRYLIRTLYFSFRESGFFDEELKKSKKKFPARFLVEFVPSRYLIFILASTSLASNQLYGFILFLSIYGAISYAGLSVVIYNKIRKAEYKTLH